MMRISRRLSRAIRKEPREFNYTSFSSGRGKKKQNEISPDINTSPRAQREEKSTTRSFSYLCHRHVWAVLVLGILRVAVHRSIRHFYCLSLSLSLCLRKQCRFLSSRPKEDGHFFQKMKTLNYHLGKKNLGKKFDSFLKNLLRTGI